MYQPHYRKQSSNRSNRFSNKSGSRQGSYYARRPKIDVSKFINKAVIAEAVESFVPQHSFVDFNLAPALTRNIVARGYAQPTPIQDRAIPQVLAGVDLVGLANTGTGKTAAFLIPLIHRVLTNPKEKVIVVVPTRELAFQINDELRLLVKNLQIFSVCCVGGTGIGAQISQLRRPHRFVIGTPGRLKDLLERRVFDLGTFTTIVLDEADRMLDMGFIKDMRFMMERMPAARQTLFFCATMLPEIAKLIKDFLRNPITISVKTRDTSKNVDQDIVKIGSGRSKIDVLHELLKQAEFTKVLVFGQTKFGVERLSKLLVSRGFSAESIHGNKNQSKRRQALDQFKGNQVQILIATDVAARGLDISDVSHVINYDLPATYEDYVHRIGRTGRGNKQGKALTFIE